MVMSDNRDFNTFKGGSVIVAEAFGTDVVAAKYNNNIRLDLSADHGRSVPNNVNRERFV